MKEIKYATADIETYGLGGEVTVIACAYSAADARIYRNWSEFVIELFERKITTVFFHYGGKYDMLYLLDWFFKTGSKELNLFVHANSFYETAGRIIAFRIGNKSGNSVQFRDSYALLPMALEKLSSALLGGERKMLDASRITEYSQREIDEYCVDDALKLYRIIKIAAEHFGSFPRLTLASQALALYVRDFGELKFQPPDRKLYAFIRCGCYGGHVDVYKRYAEPVFQYDISSCYPYAACRVGGVKGEPRFVTKRNAGKAGLYLVVAESKGYNPFIAYQVRGKLYFPVGIGEYYVTDVLLDRYPELVKKIICGVEYEKDEIAFRKYMMMWYEYRSRNKACNLIGKLLMNNLIGKFAIKRERHTTVLGAKCDVYYDVEKKLGIRKNFVDFAYSNPLITARITEFARLLLAGYQREAVEKGALVYSDTDSVYSDKPLLASENKALGALMFESKYERGYFLSAKLYGCFNDNGGKKIVGKGVLDLNALSEKHFESGLKAGIGIESSKIKLDSWKMLARRGSDFVRAIHAKKILKNFELKRRVLPDGINTKPFHYTKLRSMS